MHDSDRNGHRLPVALVMSACLIGLGCTAKASPTDPAAASSSNSAVRGIVVEALTGAPIDGATLSFSDRGSTVSLTTSGGGVWEAVEPRLPGDVIFEVSAPGYITRRTHLSSVSASGDVRVDLIRESAPFSLDFYRQLIRNQYDAPGNLQALKRWSRNPSFYVNITNPRHGGELSSGERDAIRNTIHGSVRHMTGGHLSTGTIEFGSGPRAEKPGVVSVTFVDDQASPYCGWSRVGADPGAITINLASRCDTPCGTISPRTLAHEVGHALGFYHVASGAVLSTTWAPGDCGSTTLSSTEEHHARVAYSRRSGNRDPDYDPLTSLFAQSETAAPVTIRCGASGH
jgi:hypothetical protein